MNEARKRRKAKQARRDAQRIRMREPEAPEETPLTDEVRQALAGHPLDLLGMVSMLIEATKPDPLAWLPSRPQRDTVDLTRLLDSFVDVHFRETTALLAVLGELLEDADLQRRCREEVAARQDILPPWITDLAHVQMYRAVRMTHVLGDGDEILIGAKLTNGDELTCAAFVDHNVSSVVKDAFVVPDSVDTVVRVAAERNTDPDTTFVDMSLADARAWLDHGLAQLPIFSDQSETWPGCRPLLSWLTRQLPTGGTKRVSPDWDTESLKELCDDFFTSEGGAMFDRREHGPLLEGLLETGDPLRWSVPRIERLFRDDFDGGVPLAVVLDAPDMLARFIPFAHARSGIRDELTAEALATIDEMTKATKADD
ncbi:MAG: hypothetical protein WA944_10180 [Mycobacterium sp.]